VSGRRRVWPPDLLGKGPRSDWEKRGVGRLRSCMAAGCARAVGEAANLRGVGAERSGRCPSPMVMKVFEPARRSRNAFRSARDCARMRSTLATQRCGSASVGQRCGLAPQGGSLNSAEGDLSKCGKRRTRQYFGRHGRITKGRQAQGRNRCAGDAPPFPNPNPRFTEQLVAISPGQWPRRLRLAKREETTRSRPRRTSAPPWVWADMTEQTLHGRARLAHAGRAYASSTSREPFVGGALNVSSGSRVGVRRIIHTRHVKVRAFDGASVVGLVRPARGTTASRCPAIRRAAVPIGRDCPARRDGRGHSIFPQQLGHVLKKRRVALRGPRSRRSANRRLSGSSRGSLRVNRRQDMRGFRSRHAPRECF